MTTLRDDLRQTLPFCIAFAALFSLCYSGASWITGRYASLPVWDLPFESAIPFVPSMAVVYLTLNPALMLAPLLFRKRHELAPLAVVLCLETLIATACFLLFPQTTSFARPPVTGWARFPFALADAMNLRYNQFPSLHVTFACTVAWAYAQRGGILGRIGWPLWSVAVAASTLLIWEHHLVDIFGGAVLAAMMMTTLHPRLQRRDVQQAIRIELSCLWQCALFSRRHPRYFIIFLAIYIPSLLHWRRYRAVRVGFCAAQWIDDLLDGDRKSAREPLEVIEELVEEMSRGVFSSQALSRLTRALFHELSASGRSDFIALVRTMQRDRQRVLGGEVWSAHDLDEHHRATFALSVNLMLTTAGCAARAEEVPALIDSLAWCSVFRDLDDDLRKGLINVPAPVWNAGATAHALWDRESQLRACAAIATASGEIARLEDPRARRILAIFQSSIERFAKGRGSVSDTSVALSS